MVLKVKITWSNGDVRHLVSDFLITSVNEKDRLLNNGVSIGFSDSSTMKVEKGMKIEIEIE